LIDFDHSDRSLVDEYRESRIRGGMKLQGGVLRTNVWGTEGYWRTCGKLAGWFFRFMAFLGAMQIATTRL
jgi:hypothetical protein